MSSSARRGAFMVVTLAVIVFAAARCTDDVGPNDGTADAGLKACDNDSVCGPPEFLCKGGFCQKNTCSSDADCGGGSCNLLTGTCQAGGGDGGTPDGGGGGTACVTKFDCPAGKICKLSGGAKACVDPQAGTGCQAPGPGEPAFTCYSCNTTLDCPRGFLCDFQKLCYPGCKPGDTGQPSPDCAEPLLCDTRDFKCHACSLGNPCAAGKTCVGGECVTPTTCTSTADCKAAKDGSVCLASGGTKTCGGCATTADCKDYVDGSGRPNRVCAADGLCKEVGECTDAACKTLLNTQKAYCDTASMTCKTYECTTDADCSQAMPTCDLVTHACVQTPAGCDAAALQQCQTDCAAQGSTCNPGTCACGGTTPGTGVEGDPCTVPTDCGQGLTCGMGICSAGAVKADGSGPCSALDCALGGFLGGGGCVSSVDPSHQCDSTMCLMTSLMGGMGGTGGSTGGCCSDSECPPDANGNPVTCESMLGAPMCPLITGNCAGSSSSTEAAPCL